MSKKPQFNRKPTSPWFEKVPDNIRAMLTARPSEDLPPLFVKRIGARGQAAVPELIEILIDLELSDQSAPGGGWAPIHAAGLLGHLKAVDAIPALLDVFLGVEIDDVLASVSLGAIINIGEDAEKPLLEALDGLDPEVMPDHYAELVSALVELECADERMGPAIDTVVGLSSVLGAVLLANHLGEEALPRIAALMEVEPITVILEEEQEEGEGDLDGDVDGDVDASDDAEDLDEDEEGEEEADMGPMPHPYLELVAIYEELGGELSPAQVEKRDAAVAFAMANGLALPGVEEAAAEKPAGPPNGKKPGRNEDCWCGSGKKYKKCHADADEAR